MKNTHVGLMLLALMSLTGVPHRSEAVSFNVSTVADKNTPIPDGTGNFGCLVGSSISISGSNVAFWGSGFRPPFFCEPSGIYLFDGTTLIKVADTSTAIPDGSGTFVTFDIHPVVSDGYVAFRAKGSGTQEGIYLYDGATLRTVADRETPIPDGVGKFLAFVGSPVLSGNHVAFFGAGSGGGGFYLFNGSNLVRVADGNTPVPPGGLGNFFGFASVAISDGNVLIDASGSSFGHEGVYVFDGTSFSTVADTGTPIPGGTGTFTVFYSDSLLINGDTVTFKAAGRGMQVGIYFFDGTTLGRVADAGTAIPGGTGTFDDFGYPALGNGRVAFLGLAGGAQQGIYLFDGAALNAVADTTTLVPDGVGTFTSFSDPAMSDRNAVFHGRDSSDEGGLYLFNGTTLSVVADTHTAIPGGPGHFTAFATAPLISDGNVVFSARGSGTQEGIFLATHELIGPAKAWVGLKSSDDVGLRVDVLAEIFRNDALIARGQLDDQSTGSSGFNNARLKTIALNPTGGPVPFAPGDRLSVRLSLRTTCPGGGHPSGTVRLWYDGAPVDSGKRKDAASRFGATVGSAINDYFLRSGFQLTEAPGSSRGFVDAFVDSSVACSARPFTQFGTWDTVLP